MKKSKYHFDYSVFDEPMDCGGRAVYQIGEMYFEGAGVIESHIQICDEISYIISGAGRFTTGGESFEVGAGDAVYSYFGDDHRIESAARSPLRFYYIGFEREERDISLLEPIKRAGRKVNCPQIKDVFSSIIDEIYNRRDFTGEMIGASLMTMLITLSRACAGTPESAVTGSSLVYQLANYLSGHTDDPNALSRLEDEFHYSYGFLFRHFSGVMGQSLRAYFNALRMERAEAMLEGGKTVTETAYALGYSSVHPFSRAYKNHFGHSPTKK